MRSMLSATCMIAALVPAQAQVASPPIVPSKPQVGATARPALQTPAGTASAMAQAERLAIQSDLAWNGDFNGTINGEVSERMVAAIRNFQRDNGGKQTGVLNPQERGILSAAARKHQDNVGWKLITDAVTGARLGIPARLVPQQASDASGSRWWSSTGTIQITVARRREEAPSTARLAEQERSEPGRKVDYSLVKPDFFVLSGLQGQKKFYIRGQFRDSEVRILRILYDQATEGMMNPVVIAMSSAFNPFPTSAQPGPPPRKKVEYASGIVVSEDGAIITDRAAVDGCLSIVAAGLGPADRIAEDKVQDLALLRVYGARGLAPLALGTGPAKSAVELTGIADPQAQAGGGAVSIARVVAAAGDGGETALQPPPGPGFSGAAAMDGEGRFAGMVRLRPALVAGPGIAAAQAALVPAEAVRAFVATNAVSEGGGRDARAAMVRVICVRK